MTMLVSEEFIQFYREVIRFGGDSVLQRVHTPPDTTFDEYLQDMVAFGAEHGFHYSPHDVQAALADFDVFIAEIEGESDELSDLELEMVVGGKESEKTCFSRPCGICCNGQPCCEIQN